MGRHGGAGDLGQRHQALAPALAAHHEEAFLGGAGGARQGDELRDAQAGGVEELDQAVHPPGPRRLAGGRRLRGGLLGDREKPVESSANPTHLRQAAPALFGPETGAVGSLSARPSA